MKAGFFIGRLKQFLSKPEFIFFAIFFALHLGSVAVVAYKQIDVSPVQDALEYKMLGKNLLAGNGYSVSPSSPYLLDLLRPPLYPFFLAATYYFDSTGILAVIIQQIMLVLMGLFLLKIFESFGEKKIGYIFTTLFLLEPVQWMLSLQTMSELFYSFFILLAFYLIITKKNKNVLIPGLLVGVSVLSRPVGILWLPGLIICLFALGGSWRENLRRSLFFVVIVSFMVAPWVMRNFFLVNRPLLSSSYDYNVIISFGNETEEYFIESGPEIFDGKGRRGGAMLGLTAQAYPTIKKMSDNVIDRVGKAFIFKQQILCSKKMWFGSQYQVIIDMLYKHFLETPMVKVVKAIDNLFWGLMLVLTLLGLHDLWQRRGWVLSIGLVAILLTNFFINLCISYTRMRVPMLGIIFLLSGLGVSRLFSIIKYRNVNEENDNSI